MSRIDQAFKDGRKPIIPFLVAGFPSLEATEGALIAMDQAGAKIIEIGIPFSDPIADGPVISAAMHEAVSRGITPLDAIEVVSKVRDQITAGLVAMVSESIVHKSGGNAFIERLASAGFDGVIIPDIDDQDAARASAHCRKCGLTFSMLVSPTTQSERIAWLASLSTGFLYVLARVGLTGEQHAPPDIAGGIESIRKVTSLPLAVGFGISTREHVATVRASADAAIVGSALVRRMGEAADPIRAASEFVAELL